MGTWVRRSLVRSSCCPCCHYWNLRWICCASTACVPLWWVMAACIYWEIWDNWSKSHTTCCSYWWFPSPAKACPSASSVSPSLTSFFAIARQSAQLPTSGWAPTKRPVLTRRTQSLCASGIDACGRIVVLTCCWVVLLRVFCSRRGVACLISWWIHSCLQVGRFLIR